MKQVHRFHVCVVGGGVTGLACAVAAARAGARVDIHEAGWESQSFPAHINLAPNVVRDLVSLGVGDQLAIAGFPYRRMVVRDLLGREQFEMPWQQLAGTRYPAAVGIKYDTLIQVLEEAAFAAGALSHFGSVVKGVVFGPARTTVRASDGASSHPDLVVLASGTNCVIRDRLFPGAKPSAVWPQRWLHTLLSRPRGLDEMCLTMAPRGGPKLLLAPVGGRLAGLTISRHGVGCNSPHLSTLPTELFAWLRRTSDWTRSIAASLDSRIPVVQRPLRSGFADGDWHRANVLLAGDCAHVLAPQFGQSVAQGVEDAVVIGHLVHAARHIDSARLGELYTARRRPRAARVHALIERAALWDLSPDATTDFTSITKELLDTVALPP